MKRLINLDRPGLILMISVSKSWEDKGIPVFGRFRKELSNRVPAGWVCLEIVIFQILIHLGVRVGREEVDMEDESHLEIWTVYNHPSDYPDEFVARKFLIGPDVVATEYIIKNKNLDVIRAWLWVRGLVRLESNEGDDPLIVESWV